MTNNILHTISLIFMFLLVLCIVVTSIAFYFTDGNKNVAKKIIFKKLLITFGLIFYIIRFGTIFLLSILYQKNNLNLGFSGTIFTSILRFIQLIVIAVLPNYSIIQSYIFEYQFIIKNEDIRSKEYMKKWKSRGIIASALLVITLELIINLFN